MTGNMDIVEEAVDVKPEDVKPYAFISQLALDNHFVGYCYREYPETKIDSGWRFMHGTEDDEYVSEPSHSVSIYLEEVLEINPELKDILDSPVNSEFEWNEESKIYLEL